MDTGLLSALTMDIWDTTTARNTMCLCIVTIQFTMQCQIGFLKDPLIINIWIVVPGQTISLVLMQT